MSRYNEKSANSSLYARIEQMQLTEVQRKEALSALRGGETVADAILWVINAIKQLFAGAALKPSLKH